MCHKCIYMTESGRGNLKFSGAQPPKFEFTITSDFKLLVCTSTLCCQIVHFSFEHTASTYQSYVLFLDSKFWQTPLLGGECSEQNYANYLPVSNACHVGLAGHYYYQVLGTRLARYVSHMPSCHLQQHALGISIQNSNIFDGRFDVVATHPF